MKHKQKKGDKSQSGSVEHDHSTNELRGVKRVTKSPHKHRKRSKLALLLIAITTILLVIALVVLATSKDAPASTLPAEAIEQNKTDALQTLGATSSLTLPSLTTITSTLGFSLDVDEELFEVTAQVTDPSSTGTFVSGFEHEEGDLEEERPYSIVKVRVPKTDAAFSFDNAELVVITNIREAYWDNIVSPGQSLIDALVARNAETYPAEQGWEALPVQDVTINSYDYKLVEYVQSRSYGDLTLETRYHVYLTVQNDRPYIINVYNVKDTNVDQVAQMERVIATLAYETFNPGDLSLGDGDTQVLGTDTDDEVIDSVSNTPYEIDQDTVFDIILTNQPSVVRVASVRCADISLTSFATGSDVALGDTCTAGVGSGSIVSEDGYVATNGHVVSVADPDLLFSYIALAQSEEQVAERFQTILSYLVSNSILSETQLQTIISDYQAGLISDGELLSAILGAIPESAITIADDETKYYLQLGTDPFEIDFTSSRITVPTSDTIIEAAFVAMDYEPLTNGQYEFGTGTNSDVALLKAEGTFPVVPIGSVDSLQAGSAITAIGYPAFVDGGLLTTQTTTRPTVTQGEVIQVVPESFSKDNILIMTNVPIAQGNSGGPAFDTDGLQIGLNTYGQITCPDLQCFGSGTARDVADFVQLVSNQGVSLDTSSDLSERWAEALDSYLVGNFKGAEKAFDSLDDDYAAHYLATRMQSLSQSKIGTQFDRSSEFSDNSTLITIIWIALGVILLTGAAVIAYLLHGSHKANKQVRMGGAQPYQPQAVAAMPVAQQVQMQQPQPQPQMQVPQQPQVPAPNTQTVPQPTASYQPQTPVQNVPVQPAQMPASQQQSGQSQPPSQQ